MLGVPVGFRVLRAAGRFFLLFTHSVTHNTTGQQSKRIVHQIQMVNNIENNLKGPYGIYLASVKFKLKMSSIYLFPTPSAESCSYFTLNNLTTF